MVVASVVLIVFAKFGVHRPHRSSMPRFETPFNRPDIQLLALLLFYRISSTCYCRSAILLGENLIFHNISSSSSVLSVSAGDVTRDDPTLSSQTSILTVAAAASGETGDSLYIVRNNVGDTFFDVDHSWLSCSMEKCVRKSSGTATVALELNNIGDGRKLFFDRYTPNDKLCHCRCRQSTPTFREDLHVCVDDIHECALASFVSGDVQQKIPYVFLPLRGQIIYPNAEIKFHGVHSVPTCVISRVRYLSRSGWYDVKNYSANYSAESPIPFRLFHDKQRTFLQWLGNSDLRMSMEGRLLLIDLICKDTASQLIFTPCISFRVAGVASSNKFFPDDTLDHNANFEKEKKFSSHEYIALGLATLLIALIYIASVFLYLHLKKSKIKEKASRRSNAFKQFTDMEDNASHLFADSSGSTSGQSKQLIVEQEGLVKSNPLLLKRYHSPTNPNHKPLLTADEGCKFGSLHGDIVTAATSADQIDVYKPAKMGTIAEHARVTNALTHSAKQFESMEPRWSIFRNRLPCNFETRGEPKVDAAYSCVQKSAPCDATNIEEKHPDEDISIVECPEDIVQTNSKHKLYFNPAYLEPEMLMAPPPAAVEFLFKIREIMTVAKRKIATKRFVPSLTEITEENRSHSDASDLRRSPSTSQRPNEMTSVPKASEVSSPYLLHDDKEKRQIIQKWLQTIPTSDSNKSDTAVLEKLSTFAVPPEPPRACNIASEGEAVVERSKRGSNYASGRSAELAGPPKRLSPPLRSNNSIATKKTANAPKPCPEISFDSLERQHVCKRNADNAIMDEKVEQRCLRSGTIATLPGCNSSLPLDEELTMQNAIYNIVTGSTTLSKLKRRYESEGGCLSDYNENAEQNRYSLVSEVYVNDDFSSESSLSSSASSLAEEEVKKEQQPVNNKQYQESSRLMIQLNDCPFFYSMENSDEFEPDTLDRKFSKEEAETQSDRRTFVDSLERPAICLRSHGSFRKESTLGSRPYNNLKRSFGSLQEIYQQRRRAELEKQGVNQDCGPHSLSPQIECLLWKKERFPPRHYFRQRKQSTPPPIPDSEHGLAEAKPPLPMKKSSLGKCDTETSPSLVAPNFRTNSLFANKALKICFKNNIWSYRPEDSGYLSSSDSEKSLARSQPHTLENRIDALRREDGNFRSQNNNNNDDDDDDSTSCSNDANSESGAESTATNFKFYKNSVKLISEMNELKDTDKMRSVTSAC